MLDGPERQIIIGAAVTGKTIMLQENALRLLKKGESVVVFSPNSYMREYEEILKTSGSSNFEVRSHSDQGLAIGDLMDKFTRRMRPIRIDICYRRTLR